MKNRVDNIIRETIDNYLKENLVMEKVVDTFTPYTPEEAEMNHKAALGLGDNNRPLADRNRSYGDFKAWREEQMANGVPSIEASWSNYLKSKQ